jgi:hypothetical protein
MWSGRGVGLISYWCKTANSDWFHPKSVYIKSVREPVGWGRETNFIWFGTSVQTMENIFLPRELTVYNS